MKKIGFLLLCFFLLLISLTACGSSQEAAPSLEHEAESKTVELTVWGAEEDEPLLQEIFTSNPIMPVRPTSKLLFNLRANPAAKMCCWVIWREGQMYLPLPTIR